MIRFPGLLFTMPRKIHGDLHHLLSFYGIQRVRDAMLGLTQPDLVDTVGGLARLNPDSVISGVF